MRSKAGWWILVGLAGALALPAFSQSLSEAAAKERERRKATKDPVKVYTDADVGTARPAETAAPEAAAGADAAARKPEGAAEGAPAEKSPDELRAEARKAWLADLEKIDAEITRLEAEVARLEAEVNDIRGYMYGNRRTVALEQLEIKQRDLKAARDKRDAHVEAGRRQGFRR